jgi:hypothetical protein
MTSALSFLFSCVRLRFNWFMRSVRVRSLSLRSSCSDDALDVKSFALSSVVGSVAPTECVLFPVLMCVKKVERRGGGRGERGRGEEGEREKSKRGRDRNIWK